MFGNFLFLRYPLCFQVCLLHSSTVQLFNILSLKEPFYFFFFFSPLSSRRKKKKPRSGLLWRKKKGAPVTRRVTKGKEGGVKSCSLFSSLSFFFSYVEVFRYRRAEENNIRNSNKEIHRNTHTHKKKKESTCTTEKHCFFFYLFTNYFFFFFVFVYFAFHLLR